MAEYIFTDRNGVYIIDLEKTQKLLAQACAFLRGIAEKGGSILLVGTKRQAQDAIREAAEKTEMPYVNERWLGGMLTNFETVRRSVSRLEQLETMEREGTHQFLTKKEVLMLKKDREKLLHVLGGVRYMRKLPSVVFVIDPDQEEIAVLEARKLEIPVVALIDTNCNPDLIDYLIPGNDDAMRSVRLICSIVRDAIQSGREKFKQTGLEVSEEIVESKETLAVPEVPVEGVETEVEAELSGPTAEIEEVLEEKVAEKLVAVDPDVKIKRVKAPKKKKEE
jgi:small subunit ribosomal protein S2